jgi:hypothetical protein
MRRFQPRACGFAIEKRVTWLLSERAHADDRDNPARAARDAAVKIARLSFLRTLSREAI